MHGLVVRVFDDTNRKKQKTAPGFATPSVARDPEMEAPTNPMLKGQPVHSPVPSMADLHAHTPMVEIEVIHQHGPAPNTDRPFQTLEVWTQNHVYIMDPSMECVYVRERTAPHPLPTHPFVGHRLVGGQSRQGETIQLSYPFPRPGTEDVFENPDSQRGVFSRTSTVTRVVLRLHVITVTPKAVTPTWAEIMKNSEITG